MTLVARSQYNNDFKLCSKDLLTSIVFVQFLVGDVFMVEELFIKNTQKSVFRSSSNYTLEWRNNPIWRRGTSISHNIP